MFSGVEEITIIIIIRGLTALDHTIIPYELKSMKSGPRTNESKHFEPAYRLS